MSDCWGVVPSVVGDQLRKLERCERSEILVGMNYPGLALGQLLNVNSEFQLLGSWVCS